MAKKRRGRPRHQADRTATGRKSRAKPRENMGEIVLLARQRIHGLTADQAKDPLAETLLGRLFLTNKISEFERRAGETFRDWHGAAMKALKAPDALAKGGGKSADGDLVSDDYVEWAMRAVARWEVAKDWLMQANRYSQAEVLRVCIDQTPARSMTLLSYGLSYLAKRMGIGEQVKEAAE